MANFAKRMKLVKNVWFVLMLFVTPLMGTPGEPYTCYGSSCIGERRPLYFVPIGASMRRCDYGFLVVNDSYTDSTLGGRGIWGKYRINGPCPPSSQCLSTFESSNYWVGEFEMDQLWYCDGPILNGEIIHTENFKCHFRYHWAGTERNWYKTNSIRRLHEYCRAPIEPDPVCVVGETLTRTLEISVDAFDIVSGTVTKVKVLLLIGAFLTGIKVPGIMLGVVLVSGIFLAIARRNAVKCFAKVMKETAYLQLMGLISHSSGDCAAKLDDVLEDETGLEKLGTLSIEIVTSFLACAIPIKPGRSLGASNYTVTNVTILNEETDVTASIDELCLENITECLEAYEDVKYLLDAGFVYDPADRNATNETGSEIAGKPSESTAPLPVGNLGIIFISLIFLLLNGVLT